MIVHSAPEARTVHDYDYTFTTGLFLSVTVDETAGDQMSSSGDKVYFIIAEKPSPADPKVTIPAEDITIHTNHIVSVQHRSRIVTPPSPEQREEFQKTIIAMSQTIQ